MTRNPSCNGDRTGYPLGDMVVFRGHNRRIKVLIDNYHRRSPQSINTEIIHLKFGESSSHPIGVDDSQPFFRQLM